jgi:tetratricopeptide (TPR) repeat protein
LLAYAGVNRRVSFWDPETWALVFRASDARVFVRRLPVWRELIRDFEVPATFTFTVEEGTKTVPLEPQPHDSPVSDCEWRRRLGDLFFELDAGSLARALPAYERALAQPGCLRPRDEGALAAWLGAAALKDQRFDRAIVLLDRAVELDDRDVKTRANRAVALENLGRTVAAAADWAVIASQEGATPLGKAAAARAQSRQRDH